MTYLFYGWHTDHIIQYSRIISPALPLAALLPLQAQDAGRTFAIKHRGAFQLAVTRTQPWRDAAADKRKNIPVVAPKPNVTVEGLTVTTKPGEKFLIPDCPPEEHSKAGERVTVASS